MNVPAAIVEALARVPTSVLCAARREIQPMHGSMAPLFQGASLCSPAKTARIAPGQNAAIHRAVHTARPGDVLVVEARGDRAFGVFGELLTRCCQQKRMRGLVIDGCVRDVDDIRRLGFAVFCLGASPGQALKTDPGRIDVDIACAGVWVRPGDIVVGDSDGVVVVPQAITGAAIDGARAVLRREKVARARLVQGETTYEIFGCGGTAPRLDLNQGEQT